MELLKSLRTASDNRSNINNFSIWSVIYLSMFDLNLWLLDLNLWKDLRIWKKFRTLVWMRKLLRVWFRNDVDRYFCITDLVFMTRMWNTLKITTILNKLRQMANPLHLKTYIFQTPFLLKFCNKWFNHYNGFPAVIWLRISYCSTCKLIYSIERQRCQPRKMASTKSNLYNYQ